MPRVGKKGKIALIVIGIILLAAIVTGLIVAGKYSNRIKDALPQQVAKITDSLYHISAKRVRVNLITRSVTLKEVHLWPDSAKVAQNERDTTAPARYYDIQIPKLKVSSIMWDKLVGGEGFSCASIITEDADITIYNTDKRYRKTDTTKKKAPERELSVGKIGIRGNIKYVIHTQPDTQALTFKNIAINLNSWKLNKATLADTTRFALAEEADITIGLMQYQYPDFDYNLDIRDISFNSKSRDLTAGDILLAVKKDNETFYNKHKKQKEIFDIHFPTFELTEVEWERLFRQQELHASTLYLNQSKINILFDRRQPANDESKLGKYPNQMLQKLKIPIDIRKIRVNDGAVTYSEVSERTGQKGSIYFDKIDGEIDNVTNIQSLVDSEDICKARFSAKLNKYSDVAAVFNFKLNDDIGSYSVDMDINGLQSHQINEQAKAFTSIEVRSLNMKYMKMSVSGNERYSKGSFEMAYNNLGIKILKQAGDNKKEKRKKGFITFIANNLILYSHNPMPGHKLRTVNTYIKRDELKSFFNQIWRNIHEGVQETTIRDMKVINWLRKQDQKKQKRKQERKNKGG